MQRRLAPSSVTAFIGLGVLLLSSPLRAAPIPPRFSVQGVLRDGRGQLQSMMAAVTVTLYDAQQAGTRVAGPYGPSQIQVTNGLFTVVVDDANLPAELAAAKDVWLEVVEGNSIFARQQVTPELFAIAAKRAEAADALSSACVGCVTDDKIAGIAAAKITGKVAAATVADTVTNGVYANMSYADPAWITALAGAKITGKVAAATVADTVTNGVYANMSYADPMFITALAGAKITGTVNNAQSAVSFSGNLAGDVSGGMATTTVKKLNGTPVAAATPVKNQVLAFDGASWVPSVPSFSIHAANQAVQKSYGPNQGGAIGHLANFIAPANGTVFLASSYTIYVNNHNALNAASDCGVISQLGTAAAFPNGANPGFAGFQIPRTIDAYSAAANGYYLAVPGAVHFAVPVTAGQTYNFYLNGSTDCFGGATWASVSITATFDPIGVPVTLVAN